MLGKAVTNSDDMTFFLYMYIAAGEYYLPQEPESAFLYAQILSRGCTETGPFCELVDKECIDYGEDVSSHFDSDGACLSL